MAMETLPHNRFGDVNKTLVLSGLMELAAGALTGWPYALAVSDPDGARRLGIRSTGRLRQWHLDQIALGGLSVLAGTAVPDLPRRVAWPLAIGCWSNASLFGVLAFRPQAAEHPAFRAASGMSFTAVSWSFVSLAAVAFRRWRRGGLLAAGTSAPFIPHCLSEKEQRCASTT